MGEDHAPAKRALRDEVQAVRRGLGPDARARRSAAACARLVATPAFHRARCVVVYAPLDEELDVTPVAATATRDGKAVYYPRVGAAGLEFVRAEAGALRRGRFGVLEPADGAALTPGTAPTLFVVPGVAFDLRGARLGRGGGHYDRALAAHPGPARLGIAYEFQIVPRLPQAVWDVPMPGVVTDARLIGDCAAVAP